MRHKCLCKVCKRRCVFWEPKFMLHACSPNLCKLRTRTNRGPACAVTNISFSLNASPTQVMQMFDYLYWSSNQYMPSICNRHPNTGTQGHKSWYQFSKLRKRTPTVVLSVTLSCHWMRHQHRSCKGLMYALVYSGATSAVDGAHRASALTQTGR